jgi:antitoxin (DNA-binding transcriptional repressor) of toxin-antitoxin stability system
MKNQLSALVDRVRQGESILILDRGRPVARLESVLAGEGESDAQGRLARLERSGTIRRARAEHPAPRVVAERPPAARGNASALALLLEERRRSR